MAMMYVGSASGDATVRLWNVERKLDIIASGERLEGHVIEPAMTLTGHSGDVYACRFHKDGYFLSPNRRP